MRLLSIATLMITAFLVPSIASSQTVDEAGAAVLEEQVSGVVEQLFVGATSLSYQFNGNVEASPSGDHYLLSIPSLEFEIGSNDDYDLPAVRGEVLALDAVVTPLANGWQRAEWDFPSPITLSDAQYGTGRVVVNFTSQNNDAVFAPEYHLILDGGFAFDDISVTGDEGIDLVTIDRFAVEVETDENSTAPNSYNSDARMTLSDLYYASDDRGVFSIGSIELSGATARQRLDLFAQMTEKLDGLDPDSDAYTIAFLDALRESAGEKWIGDASVQFELTELSLFLNDVFGSVTSLNVLMAARNLDQEVADLGFELDVVDFSYADMPREFVRVVPTHATLNLQAIDTPIDAISRELYAFLGDAPGEEELFGPKGRRAGAGVSTPDWQNFDPTALFDIVMNSDTQMIVEDLLVEAPIGYIAAEGTIDPDPQAMMQVVASIDLQIAGLPDMIAFAQDAGGDAAQAAALASALSAMGRDGVDEDGVAIKEFDLELTAGGQVLLNGNDMSAMMGMFQ